MPLLFIQSVLLSMLLVLLCFLFTHATLYSMSASSFLLPLDLLYLSFLFLVYLFLEFYVFLFGVWFFLMLSAIDAFFLSLVFMLLVIYY